MRNCRSSVSWLVTLGIAGLVSEATAQDPSLDPSAPRKEPNILLIVDSSGSMEYKTGTAVDADGKRLEPTCDPTQNNASERSRWVELIEVLGGTIDQYRCETVSRRDPSFAVNFQLPDGTSPSDANYRTAYHRPMSGSCEVRPGAVSTSNVFDFSRPWFRDRMTNLDCTTSFVQQGDGLIDSFTSLVRFGLMTLDPLPDPGIGHLGDPGYAAQWPTGAQGGFSYFYGTATTGRPVYCSSPQNMEVGVRNGAAPAWEGKLIPFGDPDAGSQPTVHSRIKDVLVSTRPFGASPLAGALSDAMTFLWDDDSDDPVNPSYKYSPKNDRYVMGGCREQHIILLTDGEPNLDLRPHCTATVNPGGTPANALDGQCPFKKPVEIIQGLSGGTFIDAKKITHKGKAVATHIVGFASPTTKLGTDCKALSDTDVTSPGGICAKNNGTDKELEICCNLHEMAFYGRKTGETNLAFFGNDQATLRTALSDILGSIIKGTASATRPVRAPGVGRLEASGVKALRLLTSYDAKQGLWHGNIERLRWTCPSGVPEEQPKDENAGDDFNHNISKDSSSLNGRQFMTFIESAGKSDRTIRPNLGSVSDGLGTLTGTQEFATGNNFAAKIPFAAVSGGATVPAAIAACSDLMAGQTTECRDRIVQWTLGYAAAHNDPDNHRCSSPGSDACSLLGDVLHSTPTIVNRPSAILADETYDKFAEENNERAMMAYVSTNDGQLHGFVMSPNATADVPTPSDAANEKFSFIPPAVLPTLASEYPGSRLKLLDGVAIVQDVVATAASGGPAGSYPFRLERGAGDARASSNTWRTILVQGFGEAGSGYFALDITEAKAPGNTTGPRFLWQITKDNASSAAPIFGKGGTPLITTINMNVGGVVKEVAVAVLPGGDAAHLTGACTRQSTVSDWSHIQSTYAPRGRTRCYAANEVARSLTVVRLDSGEIIRTFRTTTGAAGTIPSSLVQVSPIDAPITGIPTPYPAGTGAVADRIFVGDRDGTLYKLDVSNSNPQNWRLKLFFDGYGAHPEKTSRPDGISQPLMTRPVLSIDSRDQVTIAFATGQQNLSAVLEIQYVWSITETLNSTGTGFEANVNWFKPLGQTGPGLSGEHVLGPLELFGGVLYFSTYTPPDPANLGALACQAGVGAIYGLDYLKPVDSADLSKGGEGAFKTSSNAPGGAGTWDKRTAQQLGMDSNSVIFGVLVEFAPSCYDITEGAGALALGSRARVGGANLPQMQLTFQTTSSKSSKDGLNFATKFESINLAPPRIASNIESWASILE